MSASTVRAGAAYEAVLVDKVTDKVNDIIQSLDKLKEAFEEVKGPAKDVARSMDVIGRAMVAMKQRTEQLKKADLGKMMALAAARINTASQAIGQAMIHIGSQFRTMGLIMTGAATGVAFALGSMVKEFGSAQESVNAFNAVFRESADEIGAWADSYAEAVGRSGIETRDALRDFQSFFVGLGFGRKEAAGLSQEMAILANDFASFFEIADEEAQRRFIGGLAGQSENLLKFGINVQEAELSLTEFAESIGKTAEEMNQFEKASARMEIIRRAMRDIGAEGDLFRTRFSFTNQLKALTSGFRDLRRSIGELLVGPAQSLVTLGKEIITVLKGLNSSVIQSIVGITIVGGALGAVFTAMGIALTALGPPLLAVGTAFASLVALGGVLSTLGLPAFLATLAGSFAATAAAISSVQAIKNFPFLAMLQEAKREAESIAGIFMLMVDGLQRALAVQDFQSVFDIMVMAGKLAFLKLARFARLVIAEALLQAIVSSIALALKTAEAAITGLGLLSPLTFEKSLQNLFGIIQGDAGDEGPSDPNFNRRIDELTKALGEMVNALPALPKAEDFKFVGPQIPDEVLLQRRLDRIARLSQDTAKEFAARVSAQFRSVSVGAGAFGAGFRGGRALGPAFDPVVVELKEIKENTKEQTEEQQQSNAYLREMARNPWLF